MVKLGPLGKKFLDALRSAGTQAYQVLVGKAPLESILDGSIEAAYENLCTQIEGKLHLRGSIPSLIAMPKEHLMVREKVAHEILGLLSVDLSAMDPRHEYTVAILKRQKKR